MGASIDPSGVQAAGKAAHGVADTVDKGVGNLRSAEDESGHAHLTGFLAKGALDTFFDTWVSAEAGLSLNLTTTGDKLTSSANTYVRTDDATVDPFKQVTYHYTPNHGM